MNSGLIQLFFIPLLVVLLDTEDSHLSTFQLSITPLLIAIYYIVLLVKVANFPRLSLPIQFPSNERDLRQLLNFPLPFSTNHIQTVVFFLPIGTFMWQPPQNQNNPSQAFFCPRSPPTAPCRLTSADSPILRRSLMRLKIKPDIWRWRWRSFLLA